MDGCSVVLLDCCVGDSAETDEAGIGEFTGTGCGLGFHMARYGSTSSPLRVLPRTSASLSEYAASTPPDTSGRLIAHLHLRIKICSVDSVWINCLIEFQIDGEDAG